MITLTCPSCAAKSTLGDEFAGRKAKCPKCGTRVRHLPDGTFELLSVGKAPPSPALPSVASAKEGLPSAAPPPADALLATTPPAPRAAPPSAEASVPSQGVAVEVSPSVTEAPKAAAPVPPNETSKSDTPVAVAILPELAGKLVSQSESRQNTIVICGAAGAIVATLSVLGLVMGNLTFAVAPIAAAFVIGFAWLAIRMRRQGSLIKKAPAPKPAFPARKDEDKTEAIPKA